MAAGAVSRVTAEVEATAVRTAGDVSRVTEEVEATTEVCSPASQKVLVNDKRKKKIQTTY